MAGLSLKSNTLSTSSKDLAYSPFSHIGKFRTPGLPRPGAEGKPKIRRLIEKGFSSEDEDGLGNYHSTNLLKGTGLSRKGKL